MRSNYDSARGPATTPADHPKETNTGDLLDTFALAAMAGMLARPRDEGEDEPGFGAIAQMSYRMAKFMMAERGRVIGGDDGQAS